ncbi:CBBY-like protein isoform X2 [Hordeum vulgare subsp. vulgare]|uniref:CBBY-like protein isoform X2 n=1 Tax=Hordeum vulgare subsp. vulgare TaxID=112509 RepID=UPI001D1A33D7|nr:CBBY-like protein isoform X2 [Hordeum vulgare subsp. vulgare]
MPPAPGIASVGGREGHCLRRRLLQRHLAPCPRGRLPELRPPSPADAAPVLLPAVGRPRRAGARRAPRSRRSSCRCLPLRLPPSFQSFQSLGLDCANWTEPIYADLVRKSSGDEERMLVLFFDRIGWPTSLPTSEKGSFTKSVLREKLKALEKLSASDDLPLRPGVEKFIDDALSEGVPVAILATYGRNGEKISRSIVEKLGPERTSKIKIVGKDEVEKSLYGQLVFGEGVASSLDEQLTKEVQKAAAAEKQRIAEEVASLLKLSVDINTASKSSEKIIATLRAGAEYVGCDVQNCILVAGSQPSVIAAERIGMSCIVVRSSLTARAEFHSAKAVMDGFGDTDLTVSKLLSKRWS